MAGRWIVRALFRDGKGEVYFHQRYRTRWGARREIRRFRRKHPRVASLLVFSVIVLDVDDDRPLATD